MLTIYYSKITTSLKKTLIGIEKLNARQWYSLLVYTHPYTPTSQKYFNELLKTDGLDWKQTYLLPRLVTLDSYSRSFQYKILNNVLYLNEKLFTFRKSTSPLSFPQTFWWDSTPSILRMRYGSKFMEWTRFIFQKRLHSIWPNTAGYLFRFS